MKIHPVILSGGSGTRLWPVSRAAYPKQFLPLLGETSLFRRTLERVRDAELFAPPLVVCDQEHRFLAAQQLRELGVAPGAIVLEPGGRNTAPAAAVAAHFLAAEDPDAVLLLLPSDHLIEDAAAFRRTVETGLRAAEEGRLVTFGIAPERPETGYGYIRRAEALERAPGCFRVAEFVEKPDLETAKGYLASGEYLWNAGIFLFTASALLAEMTRHRPEIVAAGRAALEAARRDLDFLRLDEAAFRLCPSISLDHAVMEPTDRAAVVPAAFAWSDVGSWDSLARIGPRDPDGNTAVGDVLTMDCRDSYLRAESRLVAALGLSGMLVVETADALLVCPRDRAQEVRGLAEELARAGRREHIHHRRVYRPWGSYEQLDTADGFQVKRLILDPGAQISLQRHRRRSEHWVVVRGEAEVTRDAEVFTLTANQSTYIPLGAVHRLRNPGETPLHIVEVQCGDYLGEDDIERLEDIYGRG